MKFVININNTQFLLTPEQTEALVNVLANGERTDNVWDSATNSSKRILARNNMYDSTAFNVMPDVEYNDLKFRSATYYESKGK